MDGEFSLLCLRAFTALDEARITHILSVTNDPVRWSDGLMARGIVHKQICLRDVDHEFESQVSSVSPRLHDVCSLSAS